MKKELEEKLYAKYPDIFKQKDLPMTQTLMCFGFDCGDGWYDILDNLCAVIENRIENAISNNEFVAKMKAEGKTLSYGVQDVPYTEAVQVKEKFGTLRFYIVGGDDYIEGAIHMAENQSADTCEICGKPGKFYDDGWCMVRCPQCAKGEKK